MTHAHRHILHTLILALVALALLAPASAGAMERERPTAMRGYAPHYAPGVMERVARVRKLPLVGCMVSSPHHPIGTWLEVTSLVNERVRVCRVTDVSAPKDRRRHLRLGWVVELGWPSAVELCGITRVGQEPPRKCPVVVRLLER